MKAELRMQNEIWRNLKPKQPLWLPATAWLKFFQFLGLPITRIWRIVYSFASSKASRVQAGIQIRYDTEADSKAY